MIQEKDGQDFIEFVNKIGYNIGDEMVKNVDLHYQKNFNFLPEMTMFIASYVVKKTFTRQTSATKSIKDGIYFFFVNMFDEDEEIVRKRKPKTQRDAAYVHVYPYGHSHKSRFIKNSHIKTVSIIISAAYLKSFLQQDAEQFEYLFESDNNFLIQEIMTDDIIRTVNDIAKKEEPGKLKDYHYKLKALELLFYLFQSLSKRKKSVYQKLRESDVKSIYKVRDKLISSLDKASSTAELKQIAGMNEVKMRKIFTQIFGMGIYDYFQHFRMKEAARLLRDEKLLVSEVGYQLGFENMSHFSRTFKKHIGKKPKEYSQDLT